MSGGSDNVQIKGGVNDNFVNVVETGHQQIESSYDQLIVPVRKQFGPVLNVPVQLENISCSVVIIQNPLGNDPIYVGGLGAQTPYYDKLYPGDYRGTIVYEAMSVPFRITNANLIQVVGTPLQSFNYRCYPNVKTVPVTSDVTPPNPDTLGPTVFATDPADDAVGVARNIPDIEIVFNEAIFPSSVTNEAITISPAIPEYEVFLDPVNDEVIHFNHSPNEGAPHLLTQNTLYTITVVAGGIKDLSENAVNPDFQFSFTTEVIDITRPTVSSIDPTSGATSVARDKTITITMSEAMDPASVNSTNVTLSPGATNNTFLDGSDPTKIKIDPTGNLTGSQLYTVTVIAGGVKDLLGNSILSQFQSTFTTIASLPGADITPPTITARSPAPSAINVIISSDVVVDFSEALAPASVTNNSIELFTPTPTEVPAAIALSNGNTRITLNPTANLAYSTLYTMFVRTAVEDVALNNLAADSTWTFTTIAPLTITNRTPAVDATSISVNTTIVIDFDAALQVATVTNNTIELFDTSTNPDTEVTCTRVLSNGNTRVTLTPSATLKFSTVYQMFVRTTVLDVNGDNIGTVDISWVFTTESIPVQILYNISGTGTWRNFGDDTELGRGLQITSTNASADNTLYHDIPRDLVCKIRRVTSSGWTGRDDTIHCRIRSSGGTLRATIGTYQDARTITTSSSGQNITFANSGQSYVMQNGDCIFVEYEDGDSSHYFEVNHTGSSVTSHCEEVFFGDDGDVHTGSSSRDMGATIQGLSA